VRKSAIRNLHFVPDGLPAERSIQAAQRIARKLS
jgi:hypothetical protein